MKRFKNLLITLLLLPCFLMVSCGKKDDDSNSKEDEPSSQAEQICVEVYIDNQKTNTLTTNKDLDYKITIQKPEDITTNPSISKYFYGYFTDENYETELTEETKFTTNGKIYARWIDIANYNFSYTLDNGNAIINGFNDTTNESILIVPSHVDLYPVETINSLAFKNATIEKVIICNGVKTICENAFQNCTNLKIVEIPKSVTTIDNGSFSECSSIKEITIPFVGNGSDETLFGYIFGTEHNENDNVPMSLKKVTITGGAKIEDLAFCECYYITDIILPESLTSIGSGAFHLCSSLNSVTIPNGVTIIKDSAFDKCNNFKNLYIPESVTSIGDYAFYRCNLKTIQVDKNNKTYESPNNCNAIIEKSTKTLILGCNNTIIPEDITSIGEAAFYGCSLLTHIVIPNGVATIGESAFGECSSLESIIIPKSVTSIGDDLFDECKKIFRIYYEGTEAEWNNVNIGNNYFGYGFTYYSETQPTSTGNYWHYDTNGNIVIW